MPTILKPCRVPWSVSQSMSGATLTHAETGVSPKCTVVFGGGRMTDENLTDSRRIELTFASAWHARVGPHRDDEDIEALGYQVVGGYAGPKDTLDSFREGFAARWRETGCSPEPFFYVAIESDWLRSAYPEKPKNKKHYLVYGRDGHVEILADRFTWREWIWENGHREAMTSVAAVASGAGID